MTDIVRSDQNGSLATVEEQVIAQMEGARRQLAAAMSIGEVRQVESAVAALCAWLKRQTVLGREIMNDGRLLKLQAERRMGEILQQPGVVNSEKGRPEKTRASVTFSPPTHKELGIDRKSAQRYREVASVPAERLEELAAQATSKGENLTRELVLQIARKMKPKPEVPPDEGALPNCSLLPADLRDVILTGDARKLAAQIPNESIVACVCDPVYERAEDYEWVARECERVLVPGGNLVVQCGALRRYEAETALRRSGLTYVDQLAEVYPYGLCALYPLRIQIGWKSHLWFSKGPRLGDWIVNRVHAKGKRSSDASKDLHEWGDAEEFASGLLERLCRPGDAVWDPFTGSGTVPVVAKRLGLSFVAFEIDGESAARAQERLAGTGRRTAAQTSLFSEGMVLQ